MWFKVFIYILIDELSWFRVLVLLGNNFCVYYVLGIVLEVMDVVVN